MSTRGIDFPDGSGLVFELRDGVIHLRVIPKVGDSAGVQIGHEHRDAVEAVWEDVRAEQDAYRTQRAEQAAEWLEQRGHRTVRDVVAAGWVDVDGVLAFAARHADAIERLRATPPATTQPSQFA